MGRVKCIDCQSVTPEGIGIIHLLMDQLKIDITKSWFIRVTVVDFKSSELQNICLKIMMNFSWYLYFSFFLSVKIMILVQW